MHSARFKWWLLVLPAILFAWSVGPTVADAEELNHTVREGDTLIKICGVFRDQTNHYSLNDLLTDIRRVNGLESNFLRIGQHLRIPVCEERAIVRVTDPVRKGAELRGMYLTGPACGVSSVLQRLDGFIAAGGNAVVFDAKDIDGAVSYLSARPLASWGAGRSNPVISSFSDMMRRLRRRDLYVVARLALFLDGELGRNHPDLALKGPQGEPWAERECVWVNPADPKVRQYNLGLAAELARAGVDEIQFDYVRFPTNGWRGDWQGDLEATAARRRDVISGFFAEARVLLEPLGVKISADLYGIMAWGRVEDLALTGQHVPTIARQVDVICPMIYPSHFGPGFEGRRRPGDDPAYFVGEGTRRFGVLAAGQAEIRPWLQAFPFRVTQYDDQYVRTQVIASRAAGGAGWCLWNPSCRYSVALTAMRGLTADGNDVLLAAVDGPAPIVEKSASEVAETRPTTLPAVSPAAMVRSLLTPLSGAGNRIP